MYVVRCEYTEKWTMLRNNKCARECKIDSHFNYESDNKQEATVFLYFYPSNRFPFSVDANSNLKWWKCDKQSWERVTKAKCEMWNAKTEKQREK